ncbi:MAG: hypothetical protein JXA46_08615 [Dehalococcoidales bacterium]|nr:hypothetical protein [Dehalococcoidales bacterium]
MRRLFGLLIYIMIFACLPAGGCAFKMGDGSPAPRPGEIISAVPSRSNESLKPSALVIPYDTDKLIRESDCIVSGRVAQIMPSKEGPLSAGEALRYDVFTDIIIEVEHDFWGAPGDRLVIRVNGGKIGNLVMWAEDVPLFAQDEKALFFLHLPRGGQTASLTPDAVNSPYYMVTGAMQGKYELRNDSLIGISGYTLTVAELERKIAAIHGK